MQLSEAEPLGTGAHAEVSSPAPQVVVQYPTVPEGKSIERQRSPLALQSSLTVHGDQNPVLGRASLHTPPSQLASEPVQGRSQPPQCAMLVSVSTQASPHIVRPGEQAQAPSTQSRPAGHREGESQPLTQV